MLLHDLRRTVAAAIVNHHDLPRRRKTRQEIPQPLQRNTNARLFVEGGHDD